jgi:hypothetical protein
MKEPFEYQSITKYDAYWEWGMIDCAEIESILWIQNKKFNRNYEVRVTTKSGDSTVMYLTEEQLRELKEKSTKWRIEERYRVS